MLQIIKTKKALVVSIAAVAAAFISAKLLVQGSALVAIPWGILALLCAFTASSKQQALALGGLFGFLVSYSYLWFDDTSRLTAGRAAMLILLITLPALFGLGCGLALSWLGWMLRKKISHS